MTISLLAYLLIPLFSAVLIQFTSRYKKNFAEIIGNITLFAGLLNISYLIFNPSNSKAMAEQAKSYAYQMSAISLSPIAQDNFRLLMIFMIYLIALAVSSFSSGFLNGEKNRHHFYSLILVSVSAMCGIVTAGDFFTLYIFVEALTITSLALIAFDDNKKGLEGSIKYFFLNFSGSLFILLAMAILLFTIGTFSFAGIEHLTAPIYGGQWPFSIVAAVILLLSGFLIKSGIFPFHTQVADTYQKAYAPVSAFLAGTVTKIAGVYAVVKIAIIFKFFDLKPYEISETLMLIGAISILFGAAYAARQKDLKKMLAFSSISQIGYIILAAGLATPLALLGAIFHMFNHATFKTILFLNGASLEKSLNTTNMEKMGGLEHSMPWTSWSSVIALMSTAGIPPLSGFWSKLLIIVALWEGGAKGYSVTAIGAGIITLAYFMVMQRKVFFGKITDAAKKAEEMPALMLAPVMILCAVIIMSGILFPYCYNYLIETITRTIL